MTKELDFRMHEQTIRLELQDDAPALVRFLRAYFEPYVQVKFPKADAEPQARPTWRVVVEQAPCERLVTGAATVDVDRSGGFLRCEARFVDRAGQRTAWLAPFEVTVDVAQARRLIILRGASEASLRVPCLRVIEDLFTHELEHRGHVFVHASAAVADGRAVLLCGNKGAGKTTGLCRLLRTFDTAKMANDNCVLHSVDGEPYAHGWPGFFKVELGTVAMHPELGRDYPSEYTHLLKDPHALWSEKEKVPLYPVQAAQRFGAAMHVQAPVAAVIFPRFDARERPELRRVRLDDIRGVFHEYVQGSLHPNHPDWMGLGPVGEAQRAQHIDRVLDSFANLELFALRWAPSYDDLLGSVSVLRLSHRGVSACQDHISRDGLWPKLPVPGWPHSFD